MKVEVWGSYGVQMILMVSVEYCIGTNYSQHKLGCFIFKQLLEIRVICVLREFSYPLRVLRKWIQDKKTWKIAINMKDKHTKHVSFLWYVFVGYITMERPYLKKLDFIRNYFREKQYLMWKYVFSLEFCSCDSLPS